MDEIKLITELKEFRDLTRKTMELIDLAIEKGKCQETQTGLDKQKETSQYQTQTKKK